MKYKLNDKIVEYDAQGRANPGDDTVLLRKAVDLSEGMPWANEGFTVAALFEDNLFPTFLSETKGLLISLWQKGGLSVSEGFNPDQYHTVVKTQEHHLAAVEQTKLISTQDFPFLFGALSNAFHRFVIRSLRRKIRGMAPLFFIFAWCDPTRATTILCTATCGSKTMPTALISTFPLPGAMKILPSSLFPAVICGRRMRWCARKAGRLSTAHVLTYQP